VQYVLADTNHASYLDRRQFAGGSAEAVVNGALNRVWMDIDD
jgi:hypothetical protein